MELYRLVQDIVDEVNDDPSTTYEQVASSLIESLPDEDVREIANSGPPHVLAHAALVDAAKIKLIAVQIN